MPLFYEENRRSCDAARRAFARYELAHTVADFCAAIAFLVGSALFFLPRFETEAIWLFVIGSAFFCAKPSLRLVREIHLWRIGRLETLARRAPEADAG